MIRRLWALLALVLVAMTVGGEALAQQPAPQRIVAVGDLHGDYGAWVDIARSAGLIDARDRWAGGRTTFVQLGDIADRGPDSLKIIRHLQKLQKEAPRSGGRVIVMVGNHEAMNVTGDLRYVDPGEYRAFVDRRSEARRQSVYQGNLPTIEAFYRGRDPQMTAKAIRDAWLAATPLGKVEHQAAWGPAGELGKWVAASPAVVKIGDSLFAHGGISAPYAAMSIEEINSRVKAALEAGDGGPGSILNDPLGPLWYRGLITRGAAFEMEIAAAAMGGPERPRPPIDQEIDLVLKAFGVKRMVIAHTPNVAGIAISHGGKLVRIDTGISRYYKGQPSWLEIVGDQVTPHLVRRSSQ